MESSASSRHRAPLPARPRIPLLAQMAQHKAQRVHEFVAHGATVNCLQIGRKSGSVMVSGGDDKKVNVWAVGKPNAIMSLAGHTSAIECVSFDSNEQTVIAGSAGGTLKLWDLEQAKVARTLTGHRSNCVSVQVCASVS